MAAAMDQTTDHVWVGGHQTVKSENSTSIPTQKPNTAQASMRDPVPAVD
jgi:hypothetical protein